jgi:hypothetical protein
MDAALAEIIRAAEIEGDGASFLELYERATGARVTRTRQDLEYLTLDQPGPEVIRSATIGRTGLERWHPPQLTEEAFVFYANLESAAGADFVCVRYERAVREISVEVVDQGWYEVAAQLGYGAT